MQRWNSARGSVDMPSCPVCKVCAPTHIYRKSPESEPSHDADSDTNCEYPAIPKPWFDPTLIQSSPSLYLLGVKERRVTNLLGFERHAEERALDGAAAVYRPHDTVVDSIPQARHAGQHNPHPQTHTDARASLELKKQGFRINQRRQHSANGTQERSDQRSCLKRCGLEITARSTPLPILLL